jgi:hypothetical protein
MPGINSTELCRFLVISFVLLNTCAASTNAQTRQPNKRARATIEATVAFAMGVTPENPVLATLHLKNVGSRSATDVHLLNSLSISSDEPTRAAEATYQHARNSGGQKVDHPPIGIIQVGQLDSMVLHVPKLLPAPFELLKNGKSRVYVVGILNYKVGSRGYRSDFCWTYGSGDPSSGRKCQTHNEQKVTSSGKM